MTLTTGHALEPELDRVLTGHVTPLTTNASTGTIDDTGTLTLSPVTPEGAPLPRKTPDTQPGEKIVFLSPGQGSVGGPVAKYVPTSRDEAQFLAEYDSSRFPDFAVTTDAVMLTIRDGRLCVLLIQRGGFPFKGKWALPGGFVNHDEDVADAAVRELREETGIAADKAHFEQLGTYGEANRDPRMRVVSVVYLALLPNQDLPEHGDDADDADWKPVDELTTDMFGFDHPKILVDALERVRSKLEYTAVATSFLPDEFTLAELRAVYEAIWGRKLHASNFNRKVTHTPGFVERIDGHTTNRGGGRPAQLYRKGGSVLLHPALLRRTTT